MNVINDFRQSGFKVSFCTKIGTDTSKQDKKRQQTTTLYPSFSELTTKLAMLVMYMNYRGFYMLSLDDENSENGNWCVTTR